VGQDVTSILAQEEAGVLRGLDRLGEVVERRE
jgi:hypothetical protein